MTLLQIGTLNKIEVEPKLNKTDEVSLKQEASGFNSQKLPWTEEWRFFQLLWFPPTIQKYAFWGQLNILNYPWLWVWKWMVCVCPAGWERPPVDLVWNWLRQVNTLFHDTSASYLCSRSHYMCYCFCRSNWQAGASWEWHDFDFIFCCKLDGVVIPKTHDNCIHKLHPCY